MTPAGTIPGFVQWFRLGEHTAVESSIASLEALGVQRLRTHLSWADYHAKGGREWYTWLLRRLGSCFDLLPCVHYTPPSLSENGRSSGPPRNLRAFADFVDLIITDHGTAFDAVELWNEPNNLLDWDWRRDPDWMKFCTMTGAAAYWAQQRGKRVVLGGPCPTDINWLRLMGRRGVLKVVDALGLHGFPGTWDSVEGGVWPGWERLLTDVRETIAPFNPDLELWITEAGYATWRHDPFNQVRAFLDAVEADADRLYWLQPQRYSIRRGRAGRSALRSASLPFRCPACGWPAQATRAHAGTRHVCSPEPRRRTAQRGVTRQPQAGAHHRGRRLHRQPPRRSAGQRGGACAGASTRSRDPALKPIWLGCGSVIQPRCLLQSPTCATKPRCRRQWTRPARYSTSPPRSPSPPACWIQRRTCRSTS